MKAYTDIEQSKKLSKILPLESADMHLTNSSIKEEMYIDEFKPVLVPYLRAKDSLDAYSKIVNNMIAWKVIPCWSLAALLQVLPLGIYDEFDNCDYELEINMIDKMPRYIRLGDIYHSQFPYDFEKDTLLDNIVESIIWLNDNKYFEL
jgi:hypothetical protein